MAVSRARYPDSRPLWIYARVAWHRSDHSRVTVSADISIDLELTNLDARPLSIDTNLVRAVDARGSSLRMIEWYRVPESIGTMPVVLGFGVSRTKNVRRQRMCWTPQKPKP